MDSKEEKNLVETAVPSPPVEHLTEDQKKALEISGQMEHTDGPQHTVLEKKARDLDPPKPE